MLGDTQKLPKIIVNTVLQIVLNHLVLLFYVFFCYGIGFLN